MRISLLLIPAACCCCSVWNQISSPRLPHSIASLDQFPALADNVAVHVIIASGITLITDADRFKWRCYSCLISVDESVKRICDAVLVFLGLKLFCLLPCFGWWISMWEENQVTRKLCLEHILLYSVKVSPVSCVHTKYDFTFVWMSSVTGLGVISRPCQQCWPGFEAFPRTWALGKPVILWRRLYVLTFGWTGPAGTDLAQSVVFERAQIVFVSLRSSQLHAHDRSSCALQLCTCSKNFLSWKASHVALSLWWAFKTAS